MQVTFHALFLLTPLIFFGYCFLEKTSELQMFPILRTACLKKFLSFLLPRTCFTPAPYPFACLGEAI
jgi:hypothetical protein